MKLLKTRKGNINLVYGMVILFSLISVLWIFMSYFIFAIGNDYIVYNLENISSTMNYSTTIMTGFDDIGTRYQSTNLDIIDNTFMLSYIIFIMSSIMVAYRSRGMNYFNFLNMITYGVMFLLFLLGIVGSVTTFFYSEWLLGMFENLVIDLPVFAYYIDSLYILSLLHFVVLFLVQVIDLDFSTSFNRKKKERITLNQNDEIL